MANDRKNENITITPDRQRAGEMQKVRISGEKVDMSVRTIVLAHPTTQYVILATRIDNNTVEIETKEDYVAGGYNVIGLDHSDKEAFKVVNGYLIN